MSKGKVIHTFQERRAIETALQELGRVYDENERLVRAQTLAERGEKVIPVILRHLNTTDPMLRSALGLVAMHLPRELIVPPLRQVTVSPEHPDQARLAALMILEHFLQEPVEESLYARLRDPEGLIRRSLQEVIDNRDRVPDIVLNYVTQLQDEPVDVALMVIRAMRQFPPQEIVPILTLLVQDVREDVAQAALNVLAQVVSPEAGVILDTLGDVLPRPLQEFAARAARKLRMRGVRSSAPPEVSWRALVTPPDLHGTQAMWFLRPQDGNYALLSTLVNADLGVQFAFWLPAAAPDVFLPTRAGERIVSIRVGDRENEVAWFLEIPLAQARSFFRRYLQQNYTSSYQLPLTYRQHAVRFWHETAWAGFGQDLPLPEPRLADLSQTLFLFRHPALTAWYVDVSTAHAREQGWTAEELEDPVGLQIVAEEALKLVGADVWPPLVRRLRELARWFVLAGEEQMARYAVTAAESLTTVPHKVNPFALALVARGVLIAVARLKEREQEKPGNRHSSDLPPQDDRLSPG